MPRLNARLAGVELYFDDLAGAQRFYKDTLGLTVSGEQPGHHVQFSVGPAFLCLEQTGVENYPSQDKAVIFLEVANVHAAVEAVGPERVVHSEPSTGDAPAWAVLHDPEGHNVLLLEARNSAKP